ncbi:MAG: dephospho-CoA kinase [Candidatus Gracilibacteria bacterium]|jgi:dephospho-CoA kinase
MKVAVLGKIASGKSEVMSILRKKGFFCIYSDKIVRELYKSGKQGAELIKKYFGPDYLFEDGEVDRVKLRNIVFEEPNKLKMLNKIIHPLVYAEIIKILKSAKGANVAIELSYLVDDRLKKNIDKLIWIDRNVRLIEKTLLTERKFSKDLAKKTLRLIKKPIYVNFVIKNDGDLAYLDFLVSKLLAM